MYKSGVKRRILLNCFNIFTFLQINIQWYFYQMVIQDVFILVQIHRVRYFVFGRREGFSFEWLKETFRLFALKEFQKDF